MVWSVPWLAMVRNAPPIRPDQKVYFVARSKEKSRTCKFVAGGCSDLRDFGPAAGDAVEQDPEGDRATGQIEKKLRDVGPDDGFHAAFEGVENGERDDDDDGQVLGRAEDHADDESDGGNADAFGDGASDEERAGGNGAHFFAEAFFDERVGGEKLAAKIAGEKKEDNEDAADQIADDQLNEGQVPGVGDGGRADDGERGGFRSDDGKGEGPPGSGFAAEKIVETDGFAIFAGDVFFAAAEAHAKSGYGEEIGDDDGEVERVNAHLRIVAAISSCCSGFLDQKSEPRIVAGLTQVKKSVRKKNERLAVLARAATSRGQGA